MVVKRTAGTFQTFMIKRILIISSDSLLHFSDLKASSVINESAEFFMCHYDAFVCNLICFKPSDDDV